MKRALLLLLLTGCPERAKEPAAPLQKPVPLEPLAAERVESDAGPDREATFTVKPFTFTGGVPPAAALRLDLAGDSLGLGGVAVTLGALKAKLQPQSPVVLAADADTYLAQVTALLAVLDGASAQVWLSLPEAPGLAWPVQLRDEANFNAWLDEPMAGKLRIVQRSDGFELQTNMGKLAGADPKGPTVPTRGGALDLVTLQRGLERVKQRFAQAPDVCFMPSYGTSLHDAARAVASNWLAKDKVVFAGACMVYPRPAAADAN